MLDPASFVVHQREWQYNEFVIGILGFGGNRESTMSGALSERIVVDPKIMVGKPVIRGTRIPVELVVRLVAQGIPETEILREYPRLEPDDVRAALTYAADVLAGEDVFPVTISD